MKYLKLFESKSVQSTRNLINEFNKFLIDIKPAVIEKYLELADDNNYYPDYGDKPDRFDMDNLELIEARSIKDDFEFVLHEFDNNGDVVSQYFIHMSEDEMNDALLKMDAIKYNL